MTEKPIIFSGEMIKAILDGRKTQKKIYPKTGRLPTDVEHLINRLINNITINPETDCWEWQRACNNHGYGTLTIQKKTRYAHRLSFELFRGEIPKSLQVLHGCDNPACVNPEHLHLGTQSDNMKECYERGRSKVKPVSLKGEKNGQSKLTKDDVEKIRELLKSNERQGKIARMYGVSQSQISNINRGLEWK